MNKIERPLLRYFGGKWRLSTWIIKHLPAHRIYVEPYGGAASVLMRKPKSYSEVYNDIDDSVFNFFHVLRSPELSNELKAQLEGTPYSRREFEMAHIYHPGQIESARRMIVRSFMGFGADSTTCIENVTSWRSDSKRPWCTPAHDWLNYPNQIPLFHDRLKGVIIENRCALEVMKAHDTPETLHYVDPPYMQHTRKSHGYRFEVTDQHHIDLIECLKSLEGHVVLSGYENDLYNSLNWRKVYKEARADGNGKRTEILWLK